MVVKYRNASETLTIRLVGSLEIQNIEEAYRKVEKIFDGSKNVILDLFGVTDADSTTLQFLIYLKGRIKSEGGSLTGLESSHTIRQIAKDHALEYLLNTVSGGTDDSAEKKAMNDE